MSYLQNVQQLILYLLNWTYWLLNSIVLVCSCSQRGHIPMNDNFTLLFPICLESET